MVHENDSHSIPENLMLTLTGDHPRLMMVITMITMTTMVMIMMTMMMMMMIVLVSVAGQCQGGASELLLPVAS